MVYAAHSFCMGRVWLSLSSILRCPINSMFYIRIGRC
uniref:Uncharacterized protein n=1 Tax=Siphoviridae sp. ct4Ap70 TaxID=2825328 RepID=A0A8S5NYP8_9CAUD|nr:MAG TPA: hypothetical protein [Siphoviridae sp. ct4Ap70]